MEPAKVSVGIFLFCYGGNGGTASIIPEIATWLVRTMIKIKADKRIGEVYIERLSDTPITMTRNRAVRIAQERGTDMILMLDSDNSIDDYLGSDPHAKPFWDDAFTFAYDRLIKGMPTVIAAPYCGPPPHPVEKPGIKDYGEVPYLFEWIDDESDTDQPRRRLELLTRNEAARLKGIYPVAALPTGVCLFTTEAFTPLKKPYFYYEWNEDHSEKQSTEDVVATRNISLYWKMEHDMDVVYAACDSWALHHKPKKVGKPRVTPVESMAKQFRDALTLDPVSAFDAKRHVDFTAKLPQKGTVLTHDQNEIYISDEELEKARLEVEREQAEALKHKVGEHDLNDDGHDEDIDVEHDGTAADKHIPEDVSHKSNGKGSAKHLRYKMISGKKVGIVDGEEIDDEALDMIAGVAQWVANNKGGPITVAVPECGTGQAVAAILATLPEESHLHAFDCYDRDETSEFLKSFSDEITTGRVMADVENDRFSVPEESNELDFVFIGNDFTDSDVAAWFGQLAKGGVLSGLGFSDSEVAQIVREYAVEVDVSLKYEGDVWALISGKKYGSGD